jgi:uncharacterized protein (DUF58 family)
VIPKDILKKIRRIQIRTRHQVSDVFSGHYHSVFKGQGMEFQEVREYVPGDEIRTIDWNVTARMGHPYVKKFIEEREMTVMLLVDISASNDFGSTAQWKKDLAAELAALLAFSATQNNDRVGLILFTDDVEHVVPPRKGISHVARLIRDVLYFEPKRRGTALKPALDFLNHIASRRTVTFLISDFLTHEDLQRTLAVTARRHDLIGVLVGDPREQVWPRAGLIEWQDAETGERLLVDTSDPHTRRRWAAHQAGRRRETLEAMRRAGLDSIEVFAGEPYEKALMKFFRMREARIRR